MNRDEILKLSPQELRMEIAFSKKWTCEVINNGFTLSSKHFFRHKGENHESDVPPYWTTNIADAFKLVDELRVGDLEIYIDALYNHFGVHIYRQPPADDETPVEMELLAEAHAEDVSFAISRAYFILQGKIPEEG